MKKFPVALQLYSVRDAMAEDLEGTLKAVSEMGYAGVEFADLFGRTPEEMRDLCKKYNLTPISAHENYYAMLADPEKVLGDYATIGCKYVAIPWFDWKFDETKTYAEFIKNVRMLGAVAKSKGIIMLYHNHDFDGRTPVVHLKDFAGQKSDKMYALIGVDDGDKKEETTQEFEFRPVGYGLQKFPEILEAATESGAQWVVVEQDRPSMGKTSMECAAMSREYLKSLGL